MKGTKVQAAMRVSRLSLAVNVILSAFKFMAGALSGSIAMISDAAHSASDVFTTVIVMIGIKISGKESDVSHPYGHERFECVAAILLSMLLLSAGIAMGYVGILKLVQGAFNALDAPVGTLALSAALLSIFVKEILYRITNRYAKLLRSSALRADAWHHRSDALSSIGSFAGILGAKLGMPILDPIASLVISLLIVKAACSIFIDAVKKMTDESCDENTREQILSLVAKTEGISEVGEIKTRKFADRILVEVVLIARGDMDLCTADKIATLCGKKVEDMFECVKKCDVRLIPYFPDCEKNSE